MNFDKIKPAVEEISLSEEQTAKILEACKSTKKKKKHNIWIPVAVAAACLAIVFSPSFFINMKGANSAMEYDSMAAESDYGNGLFNDKLADDADFQFSQSESLASPKLFECEGFRDIYAVIPLEFSQLVSIGEYEEWKSTVSISGGMAIAQFVEHFAIPREAFNIANENFLLSFGDFKAEAFNADIIYTFDREIIDEYYSE